MRREKTLPTRNRHSAPGSLTRGTDSPSLQNAHLRSDQYGTIAEQSYSATSDTLLRMAYGAIHGVLRAGENPTGTRAISFIDWISTTETSLVCALAT
jgi:hypothetical protein